MPSLLVSAWCVPHQVLSAVRPAVDFIWAPSAISTKGLIRAKQIAILVYGSICEAFATHVGDTHNNASEEREKHNDNQNGCHGFLKDKHRRL
jgi:hypothetical protein